MAITFGNTGTGTDVLTINCNGDFLLVGLNTTANTISAVTFNGTPMTQIGTTLNHSGIGRYLQMWGLVNPMNGSYNVDITGGANLSSTATSISGVNQTSVASAATGFSSTTSATSSISTNVTTTSDNAYVVSYGVYVTYSSNGTGVSNVVANADTNIRISRSTNAVTPIGTFTTTINSSGSNLNGMLSVGINPPSSGPTNLKSLDTNVKANIKSYNTNVLANIKSINTNA